MGQIVKASRNADFKTIRYELGIAISRTSHNIDGPYQTVLTWLGRSVMPRRRQPH